MKKLLLIAALASVSVAAAATLIEAKPTARARAATQASRPSVAGRVAMLRVANVGCVSCAPIVTRTLSGIPGVHGVSIKEGQGASATVRVVYDQKKVTPAALAAATTNAGYPARVISN